MNQTEKDYLIYDADDLTINEWLKNNKVKAHLVPFSIEKELEAESVLLSRLQYFPESLILA